jgi:hypothetical protein
MDQRKFDLVVSACVAVVMMGILFGLREFAPNSGAMFLALCVSGVSVPLTMFVLKQFRRSGS